MRMPALARLLFAVTAIALLTTSGLFLRLCRPKTPVIYTPQLARENFPSLAVSSPPPILAANQPEPGSPPTPLLIGFTRNWPILQQAVVSYLAAGWPARDIYVVDNTGVMDSNERGLLSAQNPFFLNHTRLVAVLGVHVLTAPTLLTFAQLQNFFLHTAIQRGWDHYWFSHMDSVAVSWERLSPYKSLHRRVLDDFQADAAGGKPWHWGIKFYNFDRLALVNVAAFRDAGGWDTHIPFYSSDCDFYSRLIMRGWRVLGVGVGDIFDVGSTLPDLRLLYPAAPNETLAGERYHDVIRRLQKIDTAKNTARSGRNFWQDMRSGGQGEPFYRDPVGFSKGIKQWIDLGREIFMLKWGHNDCDIIGAGRKYDDAWRVEKDSWSKTMWGLQPNYIEASAKAEN